MDGMDASGWPTAQAWMETANKQAAQIEQMQKKLVAWESRALAVEGRLKAAQIALCDENRVSVVSV